MIRSVIFAAALACLPGLVAAQQTTRTPSHCHALADATPGMSYVHRASLTPVAEEAVDLHYVAHASFLIRSHGGLNMVTDFTGFIGSTRMIPDVVTMNHAHDTHWTSNPDPAIPHVLPGWGPFGEGITHRLDLGEVLVRNVSTDIRSQWSGVEEDGNSIFIFEMAGLCIGHLGHLHHEPNDEQYAAIGRLDVVMAPVDGGFTLDQATMIRVLKRLRASIVIPMHWFSLFALEDFLEGMADDFTVVRLEDSRLTVRRDTLPSQPTIMVLRAGYIRDD
ncbi:MBL fold metallo-hydrolase [Sulfitobacter albidus]|uniref:MBL fold metallo-hydrolase n=1 Tax=Sulfitobacter albidus TaxID=2829501 RepID=A0A975JBB9_9RHOB|nr:MBL fold metallo-hydrolase [Sulfitobacter albidus]QUJ75293.1 MBL fold metallo-hydrolase [Sulfitobacter albidus]